MQIKDRIKELRRVRAGDLVPHPKNWRTHPQAQQDALRGVLAEVGYCDALLARELPDGKLQLIDGHLRAETTPDMEVPVLILDVNEDEADLLLTTFDPLAAMAEANQQALGELLVTQSAVVESDALQSMFTELAAEHGINRLGPGDNGDEAATSTPVILRAATLDSLAPTPEEVVILKGRQFLVEFSGGKDSTAAACWCRRFFPEATIELSFVDLGADFVGFGLFLHDFAKWLNCDLRVLRSGKNMVDRFLEKGEWPHFMFPYCQELLHEALDKRVASYDAEKVVVVRGGRRQESGAQQLKRRSRKRERVEDCNCSSCPAAEERDPESRWMKVKRLPDYRFFQPLYFSDKASSEAVLAEVKAPIWQGYGRGLCRTACRVCPGQRPRAYAAIRQEFPDVWMELLALEEKLGPGCWQGRMKDKVPTFTEQADKGEQQLQKEALRGDQTLTT